MKSDTPPTIMEGAHQTWWAFIWDQGGCHSTLGSPLPSDLVGGGGGRVSEKPHKTLSQLNKFVITGGQRLTAKPIGWGVFFMLVLNKP